MAGVWLVPYRAVLFISLALSVWVFSLVVGKRDRAGGKPFLLLLAGTALYVIVKLAVSVVRGTPAVFVVTRFNPLGAGLATVGFFLLVLEYTGVEKPVSRRTVAVVLAVPALVSSLVWFDLELLWVPVGPDASTLSGYAWETASLAIANQLYLNLLLLLGVVLLIRFGMQSVRAFTIQVGALLLAAVGPLVGNLAFQFGYVPFNPTPVTFVFSSLVIVWAIFRARFLDLTPIGRDTVLQNLGATYLTVDGDHRLIDVNESGRQLFDLDGPERFVGEHVDEVFAEHPSFRELYWELTDDESRQESVLEFDGGYYSMEILQFGAAEDTDEGRSVVIRDITDRRRREQELERRNEQLEEMSTRLQLALEATDTGVWEWDLDTNEIIWDEATEGLFGYEPGEFPGTFDAIADHVHDEDIPEVRYAMDRSLETGEDYRAEFRVQPPDDDQRWVQTRGVVETDESGMPVRMLGIQTDITDWKERERDLAAAQESAETIIEASPIPIWVQGVEVIRYANDAAAEFFGYDDVDALVGSSALSHVPDGERERARERNRTMLDDDERLPEMTGSLITTDGETREALFAAAPIQYHGDQSIVTIANDITERKERERKLRETKTNLEQSNEKLEQFAGVVSHDLRNPLNATQLRLDILREDFDEEHIEAAKGSLDRMEAMIDDLLQLARTGATVETSEEVPLATVATESWETARTEAAHLDVDVPESTTVLADPDRLRHVFENLFRNAVDHNDPPLTVRVGTLESADGHTEGDNRRGVFVEDDGDGIQSDDRAEIFEHGYTTSQDGTGFGLSIVRDIVQAHGWEMRVTDGTDGGARFEVTGVEVRSSASNQPNPSH